MTTQNPQPPNGAPRPPEPGRLAKAGSALRQRFWLTLAGVVIGGLLAVLYLQFATKIYTATATVKVGTDSLMVDLVDALRPDAGGADPRVRLQGIRRMLLSTSFLAGVVETNVLSRDVRFSPPLEYGTSSTPSLAAYLADLLTIDIHETDELVSVTVAHPNRELTAQLANSLADELVRQNALSRYELINEIRTKLEERRTSAEKELAPVRDEARQLSSRLEAITPVLEDLRRRAVAAEPERIQLEARQQELKQATNTEALLKLDFITSDPKVAELRAALAQKRLLFEEVKETYKWKHPKYIEAEREVTSRQEALSEALPAAAARTQDTLANKLASDADLQKRADQTSEEVDRITRSLDEATKRITAVETGLQPTYVKLRKLDEVDTNRDLFGNPLSVIQRAVVPLDPTEPDQAKVLLMGLIGGLVVGLLLSLTVGMVDTSLKSVEETESFLGLSVLGAVPPVPSKQPKPGPLRPDDEAHLAVAEAFRSLRTSVSVIAKEKELKSFLFTSATPKEGKTLCALGYAVSLAQQGLRTLLIECDLRRPMAAVALSGIKQDSRGVSDYLRSQPTPATFQPAEPKARNEGGLSFAELRRKQHAVADAASSPPSSRPAERPSISNVTLEDILQKTEIEGLSFVSAGTPVPNPAELVARQGLSKLLGEALRRFDRIVIDAAPLMGISDTLLLVSQVQAACLVVRAHQTPRRAVLRTVQMLRRADAPLLGVILNDFSPAKSDRYGQYYQYYGRGTQTTESKSS